MLTEIIQIKKYLANKFKLRTEGRGWDLRIVDPVPNGVYQIRIGVTRQLTTVEINNGSIHIDPSWLKGKSRR